MVSSYRNSFRNGQKSGGNGGNWGFVAGDPLNLFIIEK